MSRNYMVVLAKAADGAVEQLAHWYDTRHIPDLLKVPGLTAARRMTLAKLKSPPGAPAWDFMVIYELDDADPKAVIAEAGRRMGSPDMPASPALESASTYAVLATEAGPASLDA